jgi:hypothetical protein
MSKTSAKQKVEQLKEWISWITFQAKKNSKRK